MRALALRLLPGDDLRGALEAAVRTHGLCAACVVSCVGSLRRVELRLPALSGQASESLVLDGPLEIVSLVGTLSSDGPHLHAAVSDRAGRVHGGHLLPGSSIHTTAEIVLLELEELSFIRELDERTGWKELVIRRRE